MPRVADHDERRASIAGAFQRLVATEGPTATSFARVAREAGVSVGSIQHYFPDRAALIRFSYEHGTAEMVRRVDARVAQGERRRETIATMVLAGLQELLPLDDVRRAESSVYWSLMSNSPHDETLAEVARSVSAGLRDRLATAVANGKECGEVSTEVDEAVAAVRLLAATSGLRLEMGIDGNREATSYTVEVLRPVITTVFTRPCSRGSR